VRSGERRWLSRTSCRGMGTPEAHCDVSGQSPSRVLAAWRSVVSQPSVNQPQIGASNTRASWCFPCCCHRRTTLMAARSSRDLACCWRAIARACGKATSPDSRNLASACCHSWAQPRRLPHALGARSAQPEHPACRAALANRWCCSAVTWSALLDGGGPLDRRVEGR
jgi:hypothetical protein